MVRLVITGSEEAADAARASDESTVVIDVHQPMNELIESLMPRRNVPGPGYVAQARRNAADRQAFLDKYGALTAEQVADLAESTAVNRRQTAHRWAAQRLVFSVQHRGETLYPAFQFDAHGSQPRPIVAKVLATLPPQMTGWTLALWWDTPSSDTSDRTPPVDLLDVPDQLLTAAEIEAASWNEDRV